jgi:hypothetical protein
MVTLDPNQGPASGGNEVVLTGSGFTGATSVTFGIKSAGFTVDSDTQITATAPSNASAQQVRVTTPGGVSAPVWYYYILPPYKTNVSPSSGPFSGGTTTISGTHFSTATSVSFGANTAVPTIVNDSTLNVTVPTATVSGSVPVRVTTIGGTTNGLTYTYVAAPVVTSMSPTSGPDYGGTASTITGTGLSDVTDVLYGTEPGVILINDDTEIISYSPEGTGTVTVTVVSVGGSDATQSFTYAVTPG